MWVTAYTDASYRPISRERRRAERAAGIPSHPGGWAVWVRSDLGRIVRNGPCPDFVHDSNSAELYAVYMAVKLTIETWGDGRDSHGSDGHPDWPVKGIMIHGDCMAIESFIDWSRPIEGRKAIANV